MTKVLVTGANGHIGANLVRDLESQGYEVFGLVRQGSDVRGLEGTHASIFQGDVLDVDSIERAMLGTDLVFHLACPNFLWAEDPQEIIDTAIRGTQNVLEVAKECEVRRVVITGSSNAVGFTHDKPLDERMWNDQTKSPYIRAKNEQERRAFMLAERLDLDVISVLPTMVLGPHDYKKTPAMSWIIEVMNGRNLIPFPMNLVEVSDVARGHVLAAERGKRGERYILGGQNLNMGELQALIEKHTGHKPRMGLPPTWVLRAMAKVSEAVSSISHKPPAITSAIVDDLANGAPLYAHGKAKRELGYRPQNGETALLSALHWAHERAWVSPGKRDQAA